MTSTDSAIQKAFKVVDSCKTIDQLKVAEKFAVLAHYRVIRRLSPDHYYASQSSMAGAIIRKEIEIVNGELT